MNLSQSHPVNKIPHWDVTQGHVTQDHLSIQSLQMSVLSGKPPQGAQ